MLSTLAKANATTCVVRGVRYRFTGRMGEHPICCLRQTDEDGESGGSLMMDVIHGDDDC